MAKQKILIVDDEPKVAFFFQKNLEMGASEYEATAVHSGQAALTELQEQHYALLITDLRMPGIDGLELVRRARRVSPDTRVILVTAYGSQDVWAEAKRLDVFRSLSKPLQTKELLKAVRQAMAAASPSPTGPLIFSGDNYENLAERLEVLRIDLGAQAAIIADTSGRMLAYGGTVDDDLNMSATMVLLGGNMAASMELLHHLDYQSHNYLSYYEGPPYDLYAASMNAHYFLCVLYGQQKEASRIGFAWLYMKRALDDLRSLLAQSQEATALSLSDDPLAEGFAASLQSELDDLLGGVSDALPEPSPLAPSPSGNTHTQPMQKRAAGTAVASPPAKPLSAQVEHLLDRFSRETGIKVEKRLNALQAPVSTTAAALVIKTVAAALKNVYQYAEATIIGISFQASMGKLQGRIADNGRGFNLAASPPMPTLNRLQQEFQAQGGSFQIHAYPHTGVTLEFAVPTEKGHG